MASADWTLPPVRSAAAAAPAVPAEPTSQWFAHSVRRPSTILQAVSGCFREPGTVDVVLSHERWLELVQPSREAQHTFRSVSWTPVLGVLSHLAVFPWNAARLGASAIKSHELHGKDLLVGVSGVSQDAQRSSLKRGLTWWSHPIVSQDVGVVAVLAWHTASNRFVAIQRRKADSPRGRRCNLWRVSVDPSGTAVAVECSGVSVSVLRVTPPTEHDMALPLDTLPANPLKCVSWCSAVVTRRGQLHVLHAAHDGESTEVRCHSLTDGADAWTESHVMVNARNAAPIAMLASPCDAWVLLLCVNTVCVLRVLPHNAVHMQSATDLLVNADDMSLDAMPGIDVNGQHRSVVPTSWAWVPTSHSLMQGAATPGRVLLLATCRDAKHCILAFALDEASGKLIPYNIRVPVPHDCASICVAPSWNAVLAFSCGGACTACRLPPVAGWPAVNTHSQLVDSILTAPTRLQDLIHWRQTCGPCIAMECQSLESVRVLCGGGMGDPAVLRTCNLGAPVSQRLLTSPGRDMSGVTGMWVVSDNAHRVASIGGQQPATVLVLSFVEATRLLRLDSGLWSDITDATNCVANARTLTAGVVSGEMIQVCTQGVLLVSEAPSSAPPRTWKPPADDCISVAHTLDNVVVVALSRSWRIVALGVTHTTSSASEPHARPALQVISAMKLHVEPSCMHITPAGPLARVFLSGDADSMLVAVGTYNQNVMLLSLTTSFSIVGILNLDDTSDDGNMDRDPPLVSDANADEPLSIPHAVVVTCASYTSDGSPSLPCIFVTTRTGKLMRCGYDCSALPVPVTRLTRTMGRVPASLIPLSDTGRLLVLSDRPWVLTHTGGVQCFDTSPCSWPVDFTASTGVMIPWKDAAPLIQPALVDAATCAVLVCERENLSLLAVQHSSTDVDDTMDVHDRPCAILTSHVCITHAGGPPACMSFCRRPLSILAVEDAHPEHWPLARSEMFALDVKTRSAMMDAMRLHPGERFACLTSYSDRRTVEPEAVEARGMFLEWDRPPEGEFSQPGRFMTQLLLAGTRMDAPGTTGRGAVDDQVPAGRLLVLRMNNSSDLDHAGEAACKEADDVVQDGGISSWQRRMGHAQWQVIAEAHLPGPVTAVAGLYSDRIAAACGQHVYVLLFQWSESSDNGAVGGSSGSGSDADGGAQFSWTLRKCWRPHQMRGNVTGIVWMTPMQLCVSEDRDGVHLLQLGADNPLTTLLPRAKYAPAAPRGVVSIARLRMLATQPRCRDGVAAISEDGLVHICSALGGEQEGTGMQEHESMERGPFRSLQPMARITLDGLPTCVQSAVGDPSTSGEVIYVATALGGLVRLRQVNSRIFEELAYLEERLATHLVTAPLFTLPSPTTNTLPTSLTAHRAIRGGSVHDRRILDGDMLMQFLELPTALQYDVLGLSPDCTGHDPRDADRLHLCVAALQGLAQLAQQGIADESA